MDKREKLEAYFNKQEQWKEGMDKLRDKLNEIGFKEDFKWAMPTYTMDGKNIVGLSGFKNHFGLWFFQGVFLSDPDRLLSNAQEGKTKAMRQMRFSSVEEIDLNIVAYYLKESIENHKAGKEVKPERKKRQLEMPESLQKALGESGMIAFEKLSEAKQNEYKEYILMAKREATVLTRIEKSIPLILQGVGLNDLYRKK
ncbi:MAG: DUF1801 domain-containing protein [Saprospiraceae bacterium]|nr:DUF1801 domain-containing protein [Saprospiraceae bacterium]